MSSNVRTFDIAQGPEPKTIRRIEGRDDPSTWSNHVLTFITTDGRKISGRLSDLLTTCKNTWLIRLENSEWGWNAQAKYTVDKQGGRSGTVTVTFAERPAKAPTGTPCPRCGRVHVTMPPSTPSSDEPQDLPPVIAALIAKRPSESSRMALRLAYDIVRSTMPAHLIENQEALGALVSATAFVMTNLPGTVLVPPVLMSLAVAVVEVIAVVPGLVSRPEIVLRLAMEMVTSQAPAAAQNADPGDGKFDN